MALHLALPLALGGAAVVVAVGPLVRPGSGPPAPTGAPAAAEAPAAARAPAAVAGPGAGVPPPAAGVGHGRSARFTWPLRPRPAVVRRFVVGPQPWSPGHRGVDLAGTEGAVVRAAGAGRVTFAGRVAGIGVVVVDHGDLRTTYEPVTASVSAGTAVGAGDPIGTLDSAPSHCGSPCLHWGAIRGDVYVDPLLLVGALGPPVLLPLSASDPRLVS